MKYNIRYFCIFFNDTATTEIYTLSLHDALPIFELRSVSFAYEDGDEVLRGVDLDVPAGRTVALVGPTADRKSTRLNSSHANISYAVFCLKKKHHVLQD